MAPVAVRPVVEAARHVGGHDGTKRAPEGQAVKERRGWGWGPSVPFEGRTPTHLKTSHQALMLPVVPSWGPDL